MYKYDATLLEGAIAIANRFGDELNIDKEFIRGLETAFKLLKTEEDDKKMIDDALSNLAEVRENKGEK